MKHNIRSPRPAEPTVVLEMSLREFAGIYHLHIHHGGGTPDRLRGEIERGLNTALDAIPQPWREAIEDINGAGRHVYESVDAEWDSKTAALDSPA